MANFSEQMCPVCQVKIVPCLGGDRVIFSVGTPGTRAALWKKVCQYTQKPGCINQDSRQIPT